MTTMSTTDEKVRFYGAEPDDASEEEHDWSGMLECIEALVNESDRRLARHASGAGGDAVDDLRRLTASLHLILERAGRGSCVSHADDEPFIQPSELPI